MTQLQMIFALVAGIMFVVPFFIWGFLKFWDKQNQKVVWWHKRLIWIAFGIGIMLFLLFVLLAVLIKN